MNFDEFQTGLEFYLSDRRYRVTDKGARVVTAIRVDHVEVSRRNSETGETTTRTLTKREALAQNWFSGPPYGVVEHTIDEYDLPGCESVIDFMFGDLIR